jgi:membrane-associated phospholipid phosphatase
MKTLLAAVLFASAAVAQQQPPPDQDQENRSTIQVKPGGEAIKNKDLWEKTGYVHPFVRMPKYVLHDQKAIWTSPVHTAKSDIKWWLIFGGATGALIATDKWTVKQFPNTSTQVRLGADTSNLGAAFTLIPISAGFYFFGTAKHSEHFRETGLIAFETLIDTTIVELLVKSATDRARPLEGNGKGGFWDGANGPLNASFPSGHAINTFGLASVFAHEYPHKWWIKALICGYAGTVVGARLAARKHFPGDVVAGGAMGWFIGDYVYAKRHNPELDEKPSALRKVLAHVNIGGGAY